jgi:YfiH family protein
VPFRHGFTTRQGGVSQGPYASFNLGAKWGDDPAYVRENRRRLFRAAELGRLFSVTQVHGGDVVRVDADADHEAIARSRADALYTRAPGVALGVYTADCIALLIADPKTGAFAAAHAGWKGTLANVGVAVARALIDMWSCDPADLRVAMGPSIGPCCFEVAPDVASRFPADFVRPGAGGGGKPTVDLRAANRAALVSLGVRPDHIDADPPCTKCDRERFYSYRRDGRDTGQHVAFITRQD